MTRELAGGPVAASLAEACRVRTAALAQRGCVPRLAVVRVGNDPGDLWYERAAARHLASVGCDTVSVSLSADVGQGELEGLVDDLSRDPSVHGVLVMRPLPASLDEAAVAARLDPAKDVDGMTAASLAGLVAGDPAAFAPCTAAAVMRLLDHYGFEARGAVACVVGRSLTVGKAVALLLLARDATVTVCHSRTRDVAAACRGADLVVSAQGRAGSVTGDMLSSGAWLVDVGTSKAPDGSMAGDVDWESVQGVARAATPVPGGVGAVTCAVLAEHTVTAAERAQGRPAVSGRGVDDRG